MSYKKDSFDFWRSIMKKIVLILLTISVIAYGSNLYAAGECGYSCCLAGATGSGVTLAENIGLSLQ